MYGRLDSLRVSEEEVSRFFSASELPPPGGLNSAAAGTDGSGHAIGGTHYTNGDDGHGNPSTGGRQRLRGDSRVTFADKVDETDDGRTDSASTSAITESPSGGVLRPAANGQPPAEPSVESFQLRATASTAAASPTAAASALTADSCTSEPAAAGAISSASSTS